MQPTSLDPLDFARRRERLVIVLLSVLLVAALIRAWTKPPETLVVKNLVGVGDGWYDTCLLVHKGDVITSAGNVWDGKDWVGPNGIKTHDHYYDPALTNDGFPAYSLIALIWWQYNGTWVSHNYFVGTRFVVPQDGRLEFAVNTATYRSLGEDYQYPNFGSFAFFIHATHPDSDSDCDTKQNVPLSTPPGETIQWSNSSSPSPLVPF